MDWLAARFARIKQNFYVHPSLIKHRFADRGARRPGPKGYELAAESPEVPGRWPGVHLHPSDFEVAVLDLTTCSKENAIGCGQMIGRPVTPSSPFPAFKSTCEPYNPPSCKSPVRARGADRTGEPARRSKSSEPIASRTGDARNLITRWNARILVVTRPEGRCLRRVLRIGRSLAAITPCLIPLRMAGVEGCQFRTTNWRRFSLNPRRLSHPWDVSTACLPALA